MKRNMLHLRTSDGDIVDVHVEVVRSSKHIRFLLDDDDLTVLPLPQINTRTLKKALEWAEHHHNDTQDPDGTTIPDEPWDSEFVKMDLGSLFELILGANYLKMKGLLDLTCSCVAKMISGKSPDDVRKIFNIKNDLPPDDEEDIHKIMEMAGIPKPGKSG